MYTTTLVTNTKVTESLLFDRLFKRHKTWPRGLMVCVSDYETREPGSIPGCAHIFSVFLSFFFAF